MLLQVARLSGWDGSIEPARLEEKGLFSQRRVLKEVTQEAVFLTKKP